MSLLVRTILSAQQLAQVVDKETQVSLTFALVVMLNANPKITVAIGEQGNF